MSNEAHFEKVRKTIEDAPSIAPADPHTNGKAEGPEEARTNGKADESEDRFAMGPKGLTVSEKAKTLWIAAPFKIIGRVRDSQSEGWGLLLEWKDADNKLHRVQVADAELHADIPALCGKLASQGLKMAIGRNRQHLLQYLNDSIVEKRINSFPRTGWNEIDGKVAFVLPGQDDVIVAGEAVSSYEQAGTLEDWQNSVGRLVAGHSRPMFAVATAFAAPLLKLLNAEGGGFNLRGSSSIGKTTALRAAASVWGSRRRAWNHPYLARHGKWDRGHGGAVLRYAFAAR